MLSSFADGVLAADLLIRSSRPRRLTLIHTKFHGGPTANATEFIARELVVVFKLQPVIQTPSFAVLPSMHEFQQLLAVHRPQYVRAKTVSKSFGVLSDLVRGHEVADARPRSSRSFKFVAEAGIKGCCAHRKNL